MKYLFFVQGEGRGHLTQALALKEKLEKRSQEIVAIITGEDSKHKLPAFFKEQIDCPLFTIDSPNFIVDKQEKGIKVFENFMSVNNLWIYRIKEPSKEMITLVKEDQLVQKICNGDIRPFMAGQTIPWTMRRNLK